jgi:hypothetical protein
MAGISMDIFKNKAFSAVEMTEAINKAPSKPGLLGSLGVFTVKPVRTTSIAIEEKNGWLKLLADKPRGAPAHQYGPVEGRKVRDFKTIHIPLEGQVFAYQIQDLRDFGAADALASVAKVVAEQMEEMKQSIEVTLEHLRVGAIRGRLLDADGSTVLYNLFTEFGITEKVISFDLTTSTTELRLKVLEVKRHIEDQLGALPYDRIMALCSPGFFDALITHKTAKETYLNWTAAENLRSDPRAGFVFGGIEFREYNGKVGATKFIEDDTARIFPVGTPGLFPEYYAPGSFLSAVNTLGQPFYAMQQEMRMEQGIDLRVESNPLPLCTRPEVLIKATKVAP